jgi:hypothetical protein
LSRQTGEKRRSTASVGVDERLLERRGQGVDTGVDKRGVLVDLVVVEHAPVGRDEGERLRGFVKPVALVVRVRRPRGRHREDQYPLVVDDAVQFCHERLDVQELPVEGADRDGGRERVVLERERR